MPESSAAYPLGVCVEYRAYSRDEVTEIVHDDNPLNPVGLIGKRCLVQWHPAVQEHNNNTHVGMYIMHSLPRSFIKPAPFPVGSRAALESTVAKVKSSRMAAEVVSKWDAFAAQAPANDSVEDYCTVKPLHVPLSELLFHGLVERNTVLMGPTSNINEVLRTFVTDYNDSEDR